MKDSRVLAKAALPSECTLQLPFLCHCGSARSLEGGKAVEIKPFHDRSFPKELFKEGGRTM